MNKVILSGNLGSDPELRYTPSGTAVANVSLATNERWTDRNGEKQEHTEWHKLVFWDKLATVVNDYLHKGSKILVEGKIRTHSWEDQQTGEKRYRQEIGVTQMEFLDPRTERSADSDQDYSQEPVGAAAGSQGGYEEDDDLPF